MADQSPASAPLAPTPAPAEPTVVNDITAQAEALIEESRAIKQRLDSQLSQEAPVQVTQVTAVVQEQPSQKKNVCPPTSPKDPDEVVVAQVEGCCFGITGEDWRKILACLFTLYVCLGLYYWGLMTIAVYIRGGEQYKSLPSEFYGNFDRDFYFSKMGSRRQSLEPLMPWIKATQCSQNVGNYVCTPKCDVPTVPFDQARGDNVLTCDTYNICCEEDMSVSLCTDKYGTNIDAALATEKFTKCVNP